MATFDKEIKSNRLLQSKRYTIAQYDGQEAYTRVLDLNASEIYIQQDALPTGSLPYSGSTQNGLYITSGSVDIARYFYRILLTPSNVTVSGGSKYNTYFTISGSAGSAVSPQVIQSDQLTNFVSNKYLAAADAAKGAEDDPPGYNIVLVNGSSVVSANDYQFDYKTGVVQFVSDSVSPSTGDSLYLTGYQYVGQTLDSFVAALSGSSSGGTGGIFVLTGSAYSTTNDVTVTGSFQTKGDLNITNDTTQVQVGSTTKDLYLSSRTSGTASLFSSLGKVSVNSVGGKVELGSSATTTELLGSNIYIGNNPLQTIRISGSLDISGSITGVPGLINELTSSYALTASYALQALTASYAISASHEIIKEISSSHADFADTASLAYTANSASYEETSQTASYVLNSISSSYSDFALTASYAFSASVEIIKEISSSHANFADTASLAYTADTASYVNPLHQNVILTGSLKITGSTSTDPIIINDGGDDLEGVVFIITGSTSISRDLFIGDDLTVTDDLTVGNDTYLGNNVSTDVVTISGSILQTGSINLEGKLQIDIKNLSLDDIFLIKSASIDAVSVNNQGVFVLGEMETPPTPVAGGIFYSSSAFFMGIG